MENGRMDNMKMAENRSPAQIAIGVILLAALFVLVFGVVLYEMGKNPGKRTRKADAGKQEIEELVRSYPDITHASLETKKDGACEVTTILRERVSKPEIRGLASVIREHISKNCEPLYIFYHLPEARPGESPAWAYTHFNPDLQLKINGLEAGDGEALLAAKEETPEVTEGQVLGKWLDEWGIPHLKIIYKRGSAYLLEQRFRDGSGGIRELYVEQVGGEVRLSIFKDDPSGDYMIIQDNGKLGFYDNQGFIYAAEPAKWGERGGL